MTKKVRDNLARAVCPYCREDMNNLASEGKVGGIDSQMVHVLEDDTSVPCDASFVFYTYDKQQADKESKDGK